LAAVVVAAVWIALYTAPKTFGSLVSSREILFGVIPAVIGIAFALALTGEWIAKFWYVLAAPAFPILIVGATFGGDTDPEGAAFSWLYAVVPAGPYLAAAAGTVLVQGLLRKPGRSTPPDTNENKQ
jgi:hypothetical protein